jgi:hypothetical protein
MLVPVYRVTQHPITGDSNLGDVQVYALCCWACFINFTKSAWVKGVWGNLNDHSMSYAVHSSYTQGKLF